MLSANDMSCVIRELDCCSAGLRASEIRRPKRTSSPETFEKHVRTLRCRTVKLVVRQKQ